MSIENTLEFYISNFKKIAKENNIHIIEASVDNNDSSPFVHIDSEDFTNAFKALLPKVLYIVTIEFKVERQIGLKLSGNNDDDDENYISTQLPNIPKTPAFRSLVKKWANKEGQDHSYLACFIIDGILHFSSHQDDWATDFDAEADKIVEEWISNERDDSAFVRSARLEEIKVNAKILSEHPQFNAPKTSREKRLYLSEQVFTNLDGSSHREILDLADLMFWYRTTLPK